MSHAAAMESPAPANGGVTARVQEKAAQPLRVLFVAAFGGDRRTGAGNAVSSLAEALRGRGHIVDLMLAGDVPAAARAGRFARLLFPVAAARRIAERERRGTHYDAVVIHEPSAMAYAIARKWNPRLPPCVVMSHGVEQRGWELDSQKARHSLKTRLVYPLTELFQANYSLRHADAVACLSSDDAEYIERRLGVPAGRIRRMSNGVDAELLRVEFPPCAEPGLLFMGSWIPRKGTRELVRAFAELRAASPGLRCTVLGSGISAEAVRGEFAAGDREAVDVIPSVRREELPGLLARDQIFVLPSHFEGMPLTLLEAMAAGLPCVTTNICGMRDLVTNDRNGLLVAPGEAHALAQAICRLIQSSALRTELGGEARKTAERLTWGAVAGAWQTLLQQVAGTPETISSAYDRWHEQVASRDDLEEDLNNPWHRFARSQLGKLEGRTVVEAACGRGQFTGWLERGGARTVGLDLSLRALGIARARLSRNGESAALACADVQAIPLGSGAADVIVSCETLEHVPEPRACLRELRRVLRTGGRLILTTENYLNIWGLYRLYIAARRRPYNSGDTPQPIEQWMFSPRTRRMVRQAGFRILRTDGEGHHLVLLPGVNPSRLEARFLSHVPFLRRALRYFARHFFLLAEAV